MKLKRYEKSSSLWDFLVTNIPPSLRAERISSGYGYLHLIYRANYRRSLGERMFENKGDVIAQVTGSTVTLHKPEYFSDFHDLLIKFESDTGIDPTLEYWESPKKDPAK